MCDRERQILIDADILSEGHLSPYIHARESHLKEIALCLRPLAEGRKPVNCWLHGKPGAGKTATARYILRKLKDEAGVKGIHVNC